ncbi:MAG: helix-turn-helix domain-containing protein [Candidatus Omnitrophota bacterium]|nr:helix-turn-helix domain-containing protein [Candidatus Omnitrophota bacterium]
MSGLHRSELNKIFSVPDTKEGLLNLKEAADLLGLAEEEVRYFVSCGKIPAYKIGGEFLRFKRDQIEALRGRIKILKHQSVPIEKIVPAEEIERKVKYSVRDKIRDFLYFNDFYFLAAVLIALLIFVILKKR